MITKDIRARLQAARHAINQDIMSRDRGRLIGLFSRWKAKPEDAHAQLAFETALQHSQHQRQQRSAQKIAVSVDDSLPIAAQAQSIIQHITNHQVIVIAGETGSGKTTQLPKLCLAAGRGDAGMIGCTQPRRIAARAVASRVAEELHTSLGDIVGYQVRFSDKVSADSRIKFMTDGILLAETTSDRWLAHYDTLIIDEAHERSLNIDFLLGYLKTLLPKRPDLKLIITSATIDTQRFSAHFNHAPVIHVEGRTWPVTVRYKPPEDNNLIEAISQTVDEITSIDPQGDVLIFLSGEREIRDTHQALARRNYKHTEVLPLYARLSAKDQDRVFNPGSQRRLVLATNVAETSLTVPRIRYVIDPGQARIKRYSPRQKLDRLHIEPISQASANQRSGRCGRVAEGICYRLYEETDFISRPLFTDPEIHRSSLAGVILRMLQLRLGEIEDFPFLQPPQTRAIADGWQQLTELGAINKQRKLTAIGREMASLPVDVKLARMLVAAHHSGCLHAILIISSFLGVSDPRERPPENRAAADQAHARFNDLSSEFIGILRLWDAYKTAHEELTQNKLRQWCQQNFLGFLRMREWRELHRQLRLLCEGLGWKDSDNDYVSKLLLSTPVKTADNPVKLTRGQLHRAARLAREGKSDYLIALQDEETNQIIDAKAQAAAYQTLHRAILTGLPTQIGQRNDKGEYQAPRQRRFQLFPGSALAKKPPAWVLSATLLDTQKIWGLTNAAIEVQWVLEELPHLLTHKAFDPYWSPARGQVMACEQISLFGLIIEPKRNIHYGSINPEHAHELFIRQGLVTGQIKSRAGFIKENLDVLDQALEEEARQRRSGMVNDENWQAQWYLQRIPETIYSANALDTWWKTLSAPEKQGLIWSLEDVLPTQINNETAYPEYFFLGKEKLTLSYHFEPGADDDGVSLEVPLHLLPLLDQAKLSWLVPGLVAEKVENLIRSLPKTLRRNCVPAAEFANAFADAYLQPTNEDIKTELASFLSKITGSVIHTDDFYESQLETHLKINLCLLDKSGKLLATSRNLNSLRTRFSQSAQLAFSQHVNPILTTENVNEFPSTPIPEEIIGPSGLPVYPALVDGENGVALRVFADCITAKQHHIQGVQRLLEIALADKIKQAQKQLPITEKTSLAGSLLESHTQLRSNLVYAALHALLADNSNTALNAIRDLDSFTQKRYEVGKKLFAQAMGLLHITQAILLQFAELNSQLKGINTAKTSINDIRKQLDNLIYPGFLRYTPAKVLAHFPRYLKAIRLRLERAQRDPIRDEKRISELQPFLHALEQAKSQNKADEAAWQALRWDIEELRVSLFAQELASRNGVSAKKLMQRLAALNA